MSLVTINDLCFSFGGRELFRDLSMSIENDSRIGLVGVNGCGKTTLFNLIKGSMRPESGEILRAGSCEFAFLRQENELNQLQSLRDEVLASRPQMLALEHELMNLHKIMEKDSSDAILNRMNQVQHEFEAMGGFTFETEMKLVLTSLNFPEEEWDRSVSGFSGGEQSRIQLAKILLAPHSLLLLDEPTNHLDSFQIEFLKSYLLKNTTPYVIISHDRYFLDETVTNILDIRNKSIKRYRGNYSAYVMQSEENRRFEEKQWQEQQKYIEKEEEFIRRNLAGQKTKQAQGRRKILSRMDTLERPDTMDKFNLSIDSEYRTSKDIYRLRDVAIGFKDKVLASEINLYAGYRDRIAIIGPNGCGKSTLLRILLGEMQPLKGEIKTGSNFKIGFYGQMQEDLNNELTVMDTIWELVPGMAQGYVLTFLARFGFIGDDVKKLVGSLSGGEKARLKLAVLIHEKPNLLILDEPTNHLDVYMVDSLEAALSEYDGTLIFVSHDRYFIDKISTKKWVFTGNEIIETNDNLARIMNSLAKKAIDVPVQNKAVKLKSEKKKINPILLQNKMKEIELVGSVIADFISEKHSLELEFTKPEAYSNPENILRIKSRIKEIDDLLVMKNSEIANLEDEYLAMSIED
ncbi:MAG: ABC-F family ATP-binding cassette domain-containing protein [Candidatus Cloacimonetes bacterium]|nr:ABC-F family ATP-binding cassette domain-containing protein [Candidatus Cloacimonadota bacterium]